MKKALLLCTVALFSFMGRVSAEDGLVAEGANTIILPSSYWDGDMEWSAYTWVYKAGSYGDWNSWNPNYNQICGIPIEDAEGREWFDPDYDMSPKEDDMNWDQLDEETGDPLPIVWEVKRAPYSTDEFFSGYGRVTSQWPSYKWTENSIMADIYVRRTFTTDQLLAGPVYLACGHDDAPAEFYINGELVYERTGYEGEYEVELKDEQGNVTATVIAYANAWNNAEYIMLTDEQKALIKLNGEENVIAFHVHQNWGGAFADCGLYTKTEGGLDMGYTTPWEGKVLFNNYGGYNFDGQSPSNNPRHPWSKLYEAQEGDVYSFLLEGSSNVDDVAEDEEGYMVEIGRWREQLHFKTPIRIEDGHDYNFKVWLGADKPLSNVVVKLTDNNDDDIELAYEEVELPAPVDGEEYEGLLLEIPFQGFEVSDFKIAFDFGGGQDSTTITIKDISLVDQTPDEEDLEEKELWIGTHYFNFIDMNKRTVKYMVYDYDEETGEEIRREATEEEREYADMVVAYEEINAPEITGRVETLAWTQADFDDSMWDDQMMPVGSADYTFRESEWPGGDNTNYWIRRNFELDKVNERLSYELNVCHDDVYETYVNGHLLQKNVGWTDGKNPVQVHIPAKYLNVGKNVIATYIQQNWGGKFYDCGINVVEIDYDAFVKQFNDIIAYCQTDTLLTNRMKEEVQALIDEAMVYYEENKNDAAELRNYARELRTAVNDIFRHSPEVKLLKDTYDICRKMEDKGYWGTTLADAVIALDTCSVPSQWSGTLNRLREARKTTAMERHTENYVGTAPAAVTMQDVGDPKDNCPKYYLYNVGAKNFLGGGEAYGTHLVLRYASTPMMLIQAVEDIFDDEGDWIGEEPIEGAYFIETFRPNGTRGVMDFMGWNGFIDIPMNDKWEIIPVEGKKNVYNIAQYGQTFKEKIVNDEGREIEVDGGKKYLGWRNGDNTYAPSYYLVDTDMRTPELETNQWMFVTREELLGFIQTASEENPVDLSFLIGDPGYDTQVRAFDPKVGNSYDYWTFFGCSRNAYVFESYDTNDFNITQSIMPAESEQALPEGTYKLMVQGYYRDGIEDAHLKKVLADTPVAQQAIMFAGPTENIYFAETMPLMPIHIEANKVPGIGYKYGGLQVPGTDGSNLSAVRQAGEEYFPCGLYWNEFIFTIDDTFYGEVKDGSGATVLDEQGNPKIKRQLCIGIDKAEAISPADWAVWDNWRLKYYGAGEIDPDAIRGIESDEINKTTIASKGIYNMLGQRLSKAQKGVNIIGGKKVIKK